MKNFIFTTASVLAMLAVSTMASADGVSKAPAEPVVLIEDTQDWTPVVGLLALTAIAFVAAGGDSSSSTTTTN